MDQIKLGGHIFPTLIASTGEEQARGLMYWSWPHPIMTFIFKGKKAHKFWMKDTPSPLDLIFCRAGKVIEIYTGKPYSLQHLGPEEPVEFVIETPQGLSKFLNINSGCSAEIIYSLSTLTKLYQNNLIKNL